MVKVIGFKALENSEGEEFFGLVLQGGIEMVQSDDTGRFYATAKKCTVASTFDGSVCEGLVGEKIPGSIKKVSCEPYDYSIAQTGEVISLSHRWQFVPESEQKESVQEDLETVY
jgi:hypothetical protein